MDATPKYSENDYAQVRDFSEGFAEAREKDTPKKKGLWLHVRKDYSPAYERRGLAVGPFSQGRAAFQEADGRWVYILVNGEKASETRFFLAGKFSKNGFARVADGPGKEYHVTLQITREYTETYRWVDPVDENGQAMVGGPNNTTIRIKVGVEKQKNVAPFPI